jgi:hypothetical protein
VIVVGFAAILASLPLILLGSVLLGAGSTAVMLGRYAADLGPDGSRARMMASVLVATTFGAVAGPNLLAPASGLAAGLGLPAVAGPYLVAAVAFSAAAGAFAVGLRPSAMRSATVASAGEPRSGRAASTTWGRSGVVGLAVLGVANLVMVSVMTMAPVQMGETGSGLPAIGLVVSLHIAGMYGPSPLSSWLTGRIGAAAAACCAGIVLTLACCLAVLAHSPAALAVAMVLLGIGWNLSLLSGSTLLTAGIPSTQRPRREGLGEVAMGVAAGGGAVGGPVMAAATGCWLPAPLPSPPSCCPSSAHTPAETRHDLIQRSSPTSHPSASTRLKGNTRTGRSSQPRWTAVIANRRGPTMSLPHVVSREDSRTGRKKLLTKRKELTHPRYALSAQRRALPMPGSHEFRDHDRYGTAPRDDQ